MLSKLHRLADFTFVELTLLLQLIAMSLGLRLALCAMPLHRLTLLVSRTATLPLLGQIPLLHIRCSTHRLLALTELAAAVSHRNGHCLPRSLLLFWLLRARHEPVSVCLGVSKNLAALEAHAWVEQDGVVLGDAVSFVDRYTAVLRLPA